MNKDITIQKKVILIMLLFILFWIGVLLLLNYYNLLDKKKYLAEDFNIDVIISDNDFDGDGIDDSTDILLGAKKDSENHPMYISKYYENAYPPDNEGVCTDVVWRAFKNAGFSLRDMVSADIKKNSVEYDKIIVPDDNIDFRRVYNLRVFFDKYAIKLTNDINEIEQWMPGDIVFIEDNHIGIISDFRNKKGVTYLIHNAAQPVRDEDYLWKRKVTGHYRFDSDLLPREIIFSWNNVESDGVINGDS